MGQTNAVTVSALKTSLEEYLNASVEIPDAEPSEEYPDWYAQDGVGIIPWQNGSKCMRNGSKWISHQDNNIWEPGAVGVYDNIWAMVE